MAFNHQYFADEFIKSVAQKSVSGRSTEFEGREAYAFTTTENQLFTLTENAARVCLKNANLTENIDYRIDTDPIGNFLVTVFGKDRSKTVMAGSHLDSVLHGGKHDGVDGVASAFAYLARYAKSERKGTNFTFTIFRAEESSPMTGVACLGSQVMTGLISEANLNAIMYGLTEQNRKELRTVFGEGRWEAILEHRENPWIRKGTLYLPAQSPSGIGAHDMEARYSELHIEQSQVLKSGGYDAGVVSHIGGSTNRALRFSSSELPFSSIETFDLPRRIWKMKFVGEAAHTGGTPHNSVENFSDDRSEKVFRRDALVGACAFVKEILTKCDPRICISSISVPRETGYTTVPEEVVIFLHAPASGIDMPTILMNVGSRIIRKKGLTFEMQQNGEEQFFPLIALSQEHLLRHVEIPLIVERVARTISMITNTTPFGGYVRATVTDPRIDNKGASMKLNTRDIDSEESAALLAAILRECKRHSINVDTLLHTPVAITHNTPLDKAMISIAEEKARELRLDTLTMPSFPGHDAGFMQLASVPTMMVFETHNGKSHCPDEHVEPESLRKAMNLQHAILDHYTGRRNS